MNFDEESVHALSPQRHLEYLDAPVIVAYGTLESPEFQRQSQELAQTAEAEGKDVRLLVAEYYNHFEIIETMANPYGILGYPSLRQMGLIYGALASCAAPTVHMAEALALTSCRLRTEDPRDATLSR